MPHQPSRSPLQWLALRLRDYLHMPDPIPLYAVLGTLAANMIEGGPVWLMLVGAPGSGKTELLRSMLGVPGVLALDDFESKGAFLSGTGAKDRVKGSTGGVLSQIGLHGCLVTDDFTSVLSLDHKDIRAVLSVMRQTFGGKYDRGVGTDGGRMLHWQGRLAWLAGSTGAIDQQQAVNASLGERWVYLRMPVEDGYHKSRRILLNATANGWQHELCDLVAAFFMTMELEFGKTLPKPELSTRDMLRIIRISAFVAPCRSAVLREGWGGHDILGARETEQEGRLAATLGQLWAGLDAIGACECDKWAVIKKVALDSMPRLRWLMIDHLLRHKELRVHEMTDAIGCSPGVVIRTLEDLAVHEIVQRQVVDRGHRYVLTEKTKHDYARAFGF